MTPRLAGAAASAVRTEGRVRIDGVLVRPLVPADHAAVVAMHRRCSVESLVMRYFTAPPRITPAMVAGMCDWVRGRALAAVLDDRLIGLLNVAVGEAEAQTGEVAVLVEDRWQGRGLGTVLLGAAVTLARDLGLTTLRGDVLRENRRVEEFLRRRGAVFASSVDPCASAVSFRLAPDPEPAPPSRPVPLASRGPAVDPLGGLHGLAR